MNSPVDRPRLPGGLWDKLGNRYESLWTVEALLSVIRGSAVSVTVEPHGNDGEGVEFVVELSDGTREFYSAKRQNAVNVWSLAELTRPKPETGRSILGDLFARIAAGPEKTLATFVSQTTANKLLRICEVASRSQSAKQFQEVIWDSQELANEVEKHLLHGLALDWETLWHLLSRLIVRSADEQTLRDWLERVIERDLVRTDSQSLSPAAIRLLLYELVYNSFQKPITRGDILSHLAHENITARDWNRPTADHAIIDRRNRLYLQDVEAELIQNRAIPRKEADRIVQELEAETASVMLAGAAGLGKSCVLAQCIRELERRSVPHLVIRLDTQTGARSAVAFGRELGLSLSPVVALSGIANGKRSVLIIDQLDALSTASGRNPLLWDVLHDELFEAKHLGGIQVVLACRAYDLSNDTRLLKLSTESGAKRIELEKLDEETVRAVLAEAEAVVARFDPRHIEFLRTPLHLSIFLAGDPKTAQPATDLTQLYDRYWERKRDAARTRQPKAVRFEATVTRLAEALSDIQSLSAPKDVFDQDGLGFDANALASDHVLVFEGTSCRFFHETFFDYTYARRFVANGGRLLKDLLSPEKEQHLFRRGQVRQILAYQRGRDGGFPDYLSELRDLLTSKTVRMHLKKLTLDWLSRIPDPTVEEWKIVSELLNDTELGWSARVVPWNKPAWFPPLRDAGTFAAWLDSDDTEWINFAIRLLGLSDTFKAHSSEIAKLVRPRFQDTPEWRERFVQLCYFGELHHSRELFDLFLEKLRAGWFDGKLSEDHWYGLNHLASGNAAYAGEFLAEFLSRRFPECATDEDEVAVENVGLRLHPHFFRDLEPGDPVSVLKAVIPVLCEKLNSHTKFRADGQIEDPLSRFVDSDSVTYFGEALLDYLARALARVAQSRPADLTEISAPLEVLPNEVATYLLAHAWAADGKLYADKAGRYLTSMPCKIAVGSQAWVTRKLLQAIGEHLSDQVSESVQAAILGYRDEWEAKHPKWNGDTQYDLLLTLPESRLTKAAWHRLDELRRKFGARTVSTTIGPPGGVSGGFVPSPISDEKSAKMTDAQWVRAMRKYQGDQIYRKGGRTVGSVTELARVLERIAQGDKPRFAKFLLWLPADIQPTYFEHLLSGLTKTTVEGEKAKDAPESAMESLETSTLEACFLRMHELNGRPCGKQICWSLKAISERQLPDSFFEILSFYAQNDPNPQRELWKEDAGNGTPWYGGDAHFYGMNSVRGAAAETMRQFLFDQPDRWLTLKPAALSLVEDGSLAVRSCAVGFLLARMRENRDEAVALFKRLLMNADAILGTHYMGHFFHYAAYSHYAEVRPYLLRMLGGSDEKVKTIAVRQITVASFQQVIARDDLQLALKGDEQCRAACAGVFAHNLGDENVADVCRAHLRELFNDASAKVREQAGHTWRQLTSAELIREKDLISEFIESAAFIEGGGQLQLALEECAEQLPDLVLRIPERLLQEQRNQPPNSKIDFYFTNAAELVMRLYQQSRANRRDVDAPAFESRCLGLIDAMLVSDKGAMETELRRLEK